MTMETAYLLIIVLLHEYIADFMLQSREMAQKKSEDVKVLLEHVLYIGCYLAGIGAIVAQDIPSGIYFALFNMVIHAIIDWNIWKGYKYLVFKRYEKQGGWSPKSKKEEILEVLKNYKKQRMYAEDPVFYNFIGLDRFLHVSTLILGFSLFLKG